MCRQKDLVQLLDDPETFARLYFMHRGIVDFSQAELEHAQRFIDRCKPVVWAVNEGEYALEHGEVERYPTLGELRQILRAREAGAVAA